jgi:hypothetical protein
MNEIGFSLFGFLIVMVIFYVWGLLSIYKTPEKYHNYWLIIAPALIIAPVLLFVLSPFFAKVKDTDSKLRAIIFFLFFLVSNFIFSIFFKFGMNATYYLEISLFVSGISSMLHLLSMYIIKR